VILEPGDIVLDYASTITDPSTLERMVSAGVKAVVRYISVSPTGPSDIQPAEVAALHAAGLGILVVFEEAKNSALAGRLAGVGHGNAARNNLLRLGYPGDIPVIVNAQDTGLVPSQYRYVADYVAGFMDAVRWGGGLIVYGGTSVCEYIIAQIPSVLGIWKAGADGWSGHDDSHVIVEQHFGYVHPSVQTLGLTVDDNTARHPLKVWSKPMGLRTVQGTGPTIYIVGADGYKSPSPPGDVFYTPEYQKLLDGPTVIVSDAVLAGIPDRPKPVTVDEVTAQFKVYLDSLPLPSTNTLLKHIRLEGDLS